MAVIHPKSVLNYFHRVGAEILNFRRAMIKTHKGNYYVERALIRISLEGVVTCTHKEFAPNETELAEMKNDLSKVEFPKTIKSRNTDGLNGITKGPIFEFYDRDTGEIIFVQEKRTKENGSKNYLPWVQMESGEWVSMEPDGNLPFWKPKVGLGPGAKIIIHEGAKAASAVNDMVNDLDCKHPWINELRKYEHWGMIGGALAPHRTDYEELKKIAPTGVIYACDNDKPGQTALQKVSQNWGKSMKGMVFGDDFPETWDMADPMPPKLFARSGRYIGPRFIDLLTPATWATEVIPPKSGKGRSVTVIKADFAEEWFHCVTPEVFVHSHWPNRTLNLNEFNSFVAPFSHVDDTARFLKRDFSSKAGVLRYNPGGQSGMYSGSSQGRYINTYCAPDIVPEAGPAGPWFEFLEKFVPEPEDRHELMRWVATLIARPDIRMLYGVLLVSEMQGVGKGTLGEKVLAPLVGEDNVSYPSEQEIVDSNYNYWLSHRRLSVIHEIYAGNSSKAYNKLKTVITDRFVTVQKKYQANYQIECWVHVLACSNSMRALKISLDDRRWLIPKVAEVKQSPEYWEAFNIWLQEHGGLGIIRQWAIDFVQDPKNVVDRGSPAPATAAKKAIVEEGYSPGQMIVSRCLSRIKERIEEGELPDTTFVLDSGLVTLIKNQLYEGRHNDHLERPLTVRNVGKALGWSIGDKQCQVKAWGASATGAKIMTLNPDIALKTPGELSSLGMIPFDINSAEEF